MDAGAGAASALKGCYAGWTKVSAALLLAVRAVAEAEGASADLVATINQHVGELFGAEACQWHEFQRGGFGADDRLRYAKVAERCSDCGAQVAHEALTPSEDEDCGQIGAIVDRQDQIALAIAE